MLKNISISALFLALFLGACQTGPAQVSEVKLSARQFAEKMKTVSGSQLVDVRTPDEFAKGHIDQALNINWNGNDFDQQIKNLKPSEPVFIYCMSGARSAAAAQKMRSQGFQVIELDGGIMKWRAAGFPETAGLATEEAGMSKADFEALIQSDKQVLVDFYADWCIPCKKMKPYLEEISQTMSDRVKVIRINADDNRELCKQLQVDALPVLQLYKNNRLVWNHTGYLEKEEVVKQFGE